jgi:DNA-binding response OmpR family regulator
MSGPRVLIVEDEALIAYALRDCLLEAGFDVVGLAATDPAARDLAAHSTPEVAIVDVKLRSGTGLALARALLERGTAVLFVTGNARDFVASSGLSAAYLEKPFDNRVIASAVLAAKHLQATGALPSWAPPSVQQVQQKVGG